MQETLQGAVLVLNKGWCAIDVITVDVAICDLFRGVATAIDTGDGPGCFQAVTLQEWLKLPIRLAVEGRPADKWLGTVHGPVRVPTVIVKASYASVPMRKLRLDNRGIRQRDQCRCQVTGDLCPDGSVDHLIPKSRGGARKSWKNMVWMRRDLNNIKGDRTLKEMGWDLLRSPSEPRPMPVNVMIHKRPDKPDWDHFLIR